MEAIVRKQQQRRLVDSEKGGLTFTVRGNEVEPQKIDRYMKRKKIPEGVVYVPSPAECKIVLKQYGFNTCSDLS